VTGLAFSEVEREELDLENVASIVKACWLVVVAVMGPRDLFALTLT
jgi:hypothetical protein